MRQTRKNPALAWFLDVPGWVWVVVVLAGLFGAVQLVAVLAPARPEARVYDREQFRSLLVGKTPDEVIALVGRPESTQDSAGMIRLRYWYYSRRTRDPVTGKTDASVQVGFLGGTVNSVSFY